MVSAAGSLGDDDSSKLDKLMESINENSEKLSDLTKLLENVEDSTPTKDEQQKGNNSFLDRVEKVLSKQDNDRAGKKALEKQADLDRLAANTFRATETIVSEVLSRLGGTSFYPVLAAFRVARESVSVATGTPQSELKVMDMIKFVNQASKDVLNELLNNIGLGVKKLEPEIDSLTESLLSASSATKDLSENLDSMNKDAGKPSESPFLDSLLALYDKVADKPNSKDAIYDMSVSDIKNLAAYLSSSATAAEANKDILSALISELGLLGEVLDPTDIEAMRQAVEAEKEAIKQRREQEANIKPPVESDISQEAIEYAKTAAGIAGLGVSAGLLTRSMSELYKNLQNFMVESGKSVETAVLSPRGTTQGAGLFQGPIGALGEAMPKYLDTVGNIIGTLTGGPVLGAIGSIVGSKLGDLISGSMKAVIGLLTAIESGISQIADDLVAFSSDVATALIDRELAILNDDIRRASDIGDTIGRVTQAQTRLQLESRQAFDNLVDFSEPILLALIDSITSMLITANQIASGIDTYLPEVKASIDYMAGAARFIMGDMTQLVENTKPKDASNLDMDFLAGPMDPRSLALNPHANPFK